MKQTTLLKSSSLVVLMTLSPLANATTMVECGPTRGGSKECPVCSCNKCFGCKLNFSGRDHEVAENLVVKDNLTVCGDQCITGNLKVRGCITSDNQQSTCSKCNCCFDDEINFNALDMHRVFSRSDSNLDTNSDWLYTPDAQCIFPPLWTLVPGWSLNFGFMVKAPGNPFNPVAMEFGVPSDLCHSTNVEVDLHLFARRGAIPFEERNGILEPKEFARLVLVGSFAGKCEVLKPKVCVQKIVEVCPLPSQPEAPEPLQPRPEVCRHFTVTFCLDAKKFASCDLGQLLVVRVPLRFDIIKRSEEIDCRDLREFEGELVLSAASLRYRKKECSRKDCKPSKPCLLLKEVPTWPNMDDAQPV